MRTTVRLWRWRRNPLRRRSDIAEAWAALLAALVLLVMVPIAGVVTGTALQLRAERQRAAEHQVTAVLRQDSPLLPPAQPGQGEALRVQVPVRWTGPDGSVHTAVAQVPGGLRAGATTPVWVNHASRVVAPPPGASQSLAVAVTGGIGAAAGAGLILSLGWLVVRAQFDRHHMADWTREWAEFGPRWSHGRT